MPDESPIQINAKKSNYSKTFIFGIIGSVFTIIIIIAIILYFVYKPSDKSTGNKPSDKSTGNETVCVLETLGKDGKNINTHTFGFYENKDTYEINHDFKKKGVTKTILKKVSWDKEKECQIDFYGQKYLKGTSVRQKTKQSHLGSNAILQNEIFNFKSYKITEI